MLLRTVGKLAATKAPLHAYAIARENAQRAGADIDFQRGDVSAMPFENATFDFLICTSAFKNFSDPLKALVAKTPFTKVEITKNPMALEVLLEP